MVLDLSISVWGLMEPKLRPLEKYIFVLSVLPAHKAMIPMLSLSSAGSGREQFLYPLLLGWLRWETLSWLWNGGWGKGWGDIKLCSSDHSGYMILILHSASCLVQPCYAPCREQLRKIQKSCKLKLVKRYKDPNGRIRVVPYSVQSEYVYIYIYIY